jgi:hypothetical protein
VFALIKPESFFVSDARVRRAFSKPTLFEDLGAVLRQQGRPHYRNALNSELFNRLLSKQGRQHVLFKPFFNLLCSFPSDEPEEQVTHLTHSKAAELAWKNWHKLYSTRDQIHPQDLHDDLNCLIETAKTGLVTIRKRQEENRLWTPKKEEGYRLVWSGVQLLRTHFDIMAGLIDTDV